MKYVPQALPAVLFCNTLFRYAEIEERLSTKKDMLDEKELVLSETSQLIEVLREQATEGREETINTAKIVNDIQVRSGCRALACVTPSPPAPPAPLQARIKAVTRKMIACVSELALYPTPTPNILTVFLYEFDPPCQVPGHREEAGGGP